MPLSGVFRLAESSNPSEAELGCPLSNGCAKNTPNPPRATVRVEPKGFQAKPTRGPKLFQSVSQPESRHLLTPRNFTTPGVPETGLIWFASKLFMRFCESFMLVSVSQRTP